MTDASAPNRPEPLPDSPYGPADGVEELFGSTASSDTVADAEVSELTPTSTGDSDAVTRARRTLRRLSIALPVVGLVLSIVAIAVQVGTGGSIFGIDPVSEIVGFTLTFLGPTLLVLGLHMIVWRAMVRPLSRMSSGTRTGMIIGVGGVLSLLSVILVFVLVFLGFIVLSGLLSASDQAI
ncbi:hypothetical protein [Microcella sp.]|uniref:hypothetical protein n=1 Tax=Microcella sp. TaxID=1913979 RepID=UPI00256B7B8A|nr:hypothetical protein [Microcella sp.]MBX9471341.1 hypothetical protein [Microcella sp.]